MSPAARPDISFSQTGLLSEVFCGDFNSRIQLFTALPNYSSLCWSLTDGFELITIFFLLSFSNKCVIPFNGNMKHFLHFGINSIVMVWAMASPVRQLANSSGGETIFTWTHPRDTELPPWSPATAVWWEEKSCLGSVLGSSSENITKWTSSSFRTRRRAWVATLIVFLHFCPQELDTNPTSFRGHPMGSLVNTLPWCWAHAKATSARCCHCCWSPWRLRCHCSPGCHPRLRPLHCRCHCWGAWPWSLMRLAAGASSCWFYALWLGGSGTKSSPVGPKEL